MPKDGNNHVIKEDTMTNLRELVKRVAKAARARDRYMNADDVCCALETYADHRIPDFVAQALLGPMRHDYAHELHAIRTGYYEMEVTDWYRALVLGVQDAFDE